MTTTIDTTVAQMALETGSPAQQVLCMFGDWTMARDTVVKPCSDRGRLLIACGYKCFTRVCGDGYACMILRASMPDLIEVESLIAYPDRRGHGTAMLSKLCEIADGLDVQLWLDAVPYGANRDQIPLPKLKQVYKRYGFFPIRHPQPRWTTEFHRWNGATWKNVMLRNPVVNVI